MTENWRYLLLVDEEDGGTSIIECPTHDVVGINLLGMDSDRIRRASVLRVDASYEGDGPLNLDLFRERIEPTVPAGGNEGEWWAGYANRVKDLPLDHDATRSHKAGWLARDAQQSAEADAAVPVTEA